MKKEKETRDYQPLKIICETQAEEDIIKAIGVEAEMIARELQKFGHDYTATKAFLEKLK